MECVKLRKSERIFQKVCFIKYGRRKLDFRSVFYASLLMFLFVPSVLSNNSGWSSRLTFETIYNNTNYVHIHHKPRPYSLQEPIIYSYRTDIIHRNNSNKETKANEIEDHDLKEKERNRNRFNNKDQLLVGFAHDPYRLSVPEIDYMKGVRNIDQSYMASRGKRGVVHLYNMIYCATGCDPLSYKGYGCYCGFLGNGRPMDGIDNCCKMHDQCYENIYCPFFTVYFQPYYWKCYRGQPLCALENYQTRHQFVNGCAARLCECDKQFAMCVRRYRCPRSRALCYSSPLRLLQNILMSK